MSSDSSHIDYEELAKNAMRGVVRSVLEQTAESGLPGDHHFFISFDTTVDGVTISRRLREKYRKEMTIVLQHRFWDLNVEDDYFEVKLSFDGIPERLRIPFDAIKVFFDPSVRYGLQFDDGSEQSPGADTDQSVPYPPSSATTRAATSRSTRVGPKQKDNANAKSRGVSAENAGASHKAGNGANEKPAAREPSPADETDAQDAGAEVAETAAGAEIVSLDAFRKKS